MKTDIYHEMIKKEGGSYDQYIHKLIEEKVCEIYIELSESNLYQKVPHKEELVMCVLEELVNHSADLGVTMYFEKQKEEVDWLNKIDEIRQMKKEGVEKYLDGYEKLLDEKLYKEKIEEYLNNNKFLLVEHRQEEIKWLNQLEGYVW